MPEDDATLILIDLRHWEMMDAWLKTRNPINAPTT